MKTVLVLVLVLSTSICWAQRSILNHFSLEENPALHTVEDQYSDESLVVIKDYRAINILDEYRALKEIRTFHKIIRIQDDIGLKIANTVDLEMKAYEDLISLKIRTISSDGIVQDYDNPEYKELENKDGSSVVKIAIKGLEVGGEVEYLYSLSRTVRNFDRVYYSVPYPIQDLKFELFFSRFGYIVKTYNDLPSPKLTDNSLICVAKNVNPLSLEGLSDNRAKVNRIDYKLKDIGSEDKFSSWTTLSELIVEKYKFINRKGLISKFLENLNLDEKSTEEKIFLIEDKIKNTIVKENGNDDSYSRIGSILKTGLANDEGLQKLYAACFLNLNIAVDLVFGCSRMDGSIDVAFPHPMDFINVMFYFPEIDKYLSPEFNYSRLGVPPPEFGHSHALVIAMRAKGIKKVYNYISHSFVILPTVKAFYNTAQFKIESELNADHDTLIYDYYSKTKGYKAIESRYLLGLNNKDLGKVIGVEHLDIEFSDVSNLESRHSLDPKTPLIIKAKMKYSSIVQRIGDELLINLGKLIGTKVEASLEKNRVNDVIIRHPQLNEYKIDFKIPEGYKPSGQENLPKELSFSYDKGNSLRFKVSYEMVDDVLKIVVNEGYNTYLIKRENYADYCSIRTAAADFSNFTLVLEKK